MEIYTTHDQDKGKKVINETIVKVNKRTLISVEEVKNEVGASTIDSTINYLIGVHKAFNLLMNDHEIEERIRILIIDKPEIEDHIRMRPT